jgi:hypothetical protein
MEAGLADFTVGISQDFTTSQDSVEGGENVLLKYEFWARSSQDAQQIISAIVEPQLMKMSESDYRLIWSENLPFTRVVPFNAFSVRAALSAPQEKVELVR